MFGLVVIAWQWLKQANAVVKALAESPSERETNFLEGKLGVFNYFFEYELPKTTALAGCKVQIYDIDPGFLDQAAAKIKKTIDAHYVGKEKIPPEKGEENLAAISLTTDLETAAGKAELVIEAIPELLDLKKEMFARLDAVCPAETILATNTSTLPVTALSGAGTTKEHNPAVPYAPAEFADEALKAHEAEAAMVHVHDRTDDGVPTHEIDRIRAVHDAIKAKCPDLIVNLSSAVGMYNTAEERIQQIIHIKPEMASLNTNTMNFSFVDRKTGKVLDDYVLENTFTMLQDFGKAMDGNGVKPEIECYIPSASAYGAAALALELVDTANWMALATSGAILGLGSSALMDTFFDPITSSPRLPPKRVDSRTSKQYPFLSSFV